MADNINQIVRVFRLVEISGPYTPVEKQVNRSLNGTKIFGPITITAQTISGPMPESITDDSNGELLEWIADTILAFTDKGEVLEPMGLVKEIRQRLKDRGMPQFSDSRTEDHDA